VRHFRLRSRASLLVATAVLQAAVMAAGWLVTFKSAQTSVGSKVREDILNENARSVRRLADQYAAEASVASPDGRPEPIVPGSPGWDRAQAFVESAHLGRGAFLCLINNENRVLCHPGVRPGAHADDSLGKVDYSELPISLVPSGEPAALGELFPRTPQTVKAEFPSGQAYVSVLYKPELHAKFLVQQPEAGVDEAIAAAASGLLVRGAISVLAVVGLTAAGLWLLVRRYDTMLETINRDLEAEVGRKVKSGLSSRNALIFGLAKLADYRDNDTGKHLERICRYCELLGNQLRSSFPEIDDAWIERLRLASSMHDIGKVGIPDAILLKPGMFTPPERRLMEQHPLIGADTLVAIRERLGDDDLLNMGIQVALYHHEKVDGSGYPFGLVGDDIPLCARVVALADVYDALTSRRVYKTSIPHEKARKIILDSRGTHLDPRVVDAFESMHLVFEATQAELQPEGFEPEKPAILAAVERVEQVRAEERRMAA
jgi:HD-GYP domain-containing protein (c-di-GMP phosphodiesterase class II)